MNKPCYRTYVEGWAGDSTRDSQLEYRLTIDNAQKRYSRITIMFCWIISLNYLTFLEMRGVIHVSLYNFDEVFASASYKQLFLGKTPARHTHEINVIVKGTAK